MSLLSYTELRDVLSEEQCERLITMFGDRVQRSMVGNAVYRTRSSIRTSSSLKIEHAELPQDVREVLSALVAKWTALPIENQERWEIIRYREGEHFGPHYDFYPRRRKGNDPRLFSVATTLRAPLVGGALVFPTAGLRFEPERGKLVMWRNTNLDGTLAKESSHASLPVMAGTKWSLVTWVRAHRVQIE